jgi:hypothetical protein
MVIATIALDDGKKSPQLVDTDVTNRTQRRAASTGLGFDFMRSAILSENLQPKAPARTHSF